MRYAICNETFEGWNHQRVCRLVAELGYGGLGIIGLHWLLAKTEGLHLTSPDEIVRRRTAEYLVELARCCRDLGGELMVFGSPAQRRIPAGATREQATDSAVDTCRRAAGGIADTGIKLCLE